MQEALARMDPDAALEFGRKIEAAHRTFQGRAFPCAICHEGAVLAVISTDCDPPTSLQVCAKCAPEYLRNLADVIAEERGG